jgi:7,8-dihydropterin-6-yl-methyl-4-(beta-D-ribofuranosyl)aminobenzene 5'-phosphate synthase
MKITTLVENDLVEGRENLVAEFGLSLHVDTGDRKILFDTGTSGVFADNAAALGVDLTEVDAAVLSHHHLDHGGGLERFLQANDHAPVYLRRAEPSDRYFKALAVLKRPIGLDLGLLNRFEHRIQPIPHDTEIAPGVLLITEIGSTHDRPEGNRHLFVARDGELVPDPFDHELVMVVHGDDGMVVFSGCSHHGILNMVEAATNRLPGVPIKAVIGGFHLIDLPIFNTMAGTRRDVENLGKSLLDFAPEKVYSGHCTGRRAFRVLARVMGDVLEPFHTGSVLEV